MPHCNCGKSFVCKDHGNVLQINHAGNHGVIWLSNNETYIRRSSYLSTRAPRQRHIGTFKTLDKAKTSLMIALGRRQHA